MSRLLLHVCCAPCSVAVIDELRRSFDVVAYFYNPNIFPKAEYEKRKAEVIRVCRDWHIDVVDRDHQPEHWESTCGTIKQAGDGGPRCSACFRLRLESAARFASNNDIGTFATSLTSGSRKNASVINAIAKIYAEKFGLTFLDEDWKTGGRAERKVDFIRELKIYQQQYCGCRFSFEDMLARRDEGRGKERN